MSLDASNAIQTDEPIVVECYLAASPEAVFSAWTNPEILVKWFGYSPNFLHSAEIDLKIGGKWKFISSIDDGKINSIEGVYLDIQFAERLLFTWSHVIECADGEREESLQAQVEVLFTASGIGTDVRLVHSVLSETESRSGIGECWEFSFGQLVPVVPDL